jgi:hypothetical protein
VSLPGPAAIFRLRFCLRGSIAIDARAVFPHDTTLYPTRHIIDTDAQFDAFAVGEIVGATDLPQPKVNKCLIALVGRKAVGKSMVGVSDGLFLFFSGQFFFIGRDLAFSFSLDEISNSALHTIYVG